MAACTLWVIAAVGEGLGHKGVLTRTNSFDMRQQLGPRRP